MVGDRRALRSSLKLLVGGIAVNILIGVIIGLITVNRMPIDVNPQIVGRTAPAVLDLTVAIAVGIAGSFALARRDVADILAGVAIAISLVPVLAVVGITLGSGHFSLAAGAFVLFLTNAAAILIAGAIVFKAAGYAREAENLDERAGRRARLAIIVLVLLLMIPLGASSASILQYELWKEDAQTATEKWLKGSTWVFDTAEQSGNELVLTVRGPDSPPPVGDLKSGDPREDPGLGTRDPDRGGRPQVAALGGRPTSRVPAGEQSGGGRVWRRARRLMSSPRRSLMPDRHRWCAPVAANQSRATVRGTPVRSRTVRIPTGRRRRARRAASRP